jgi:hypothetical protein
MGTRLDNPLIVIPAEAGIPLPSTGAGEGKVSFQLPLE